MNQYFDSCVQNSIGTAKLKDFYILIIPKYSFIVYILHQTLYFNTDSYKSHIHVYVFAYMLTHRQCQTSEQLV